MINKEIKTLRDALPYMFIGIGFGSFIGSMFGDMIIRKSIDYTILTNSLQNGVIYILLFLTGLAWHFYNYIKHKRKSHN